MRLLAKLLTIGSLALIAQAVKSGEAAKGIISESEYKILKDYHLQLGKVLKELKEVATNGSSITREMESHWYHIGLEIAAYEMIKERDKVKE